MSCLPIYLYGTDVLRKKAKPVVEVNDKIIALVLDMFETMRSANGIGLAANQVGQLYRVIVIDISDVEETKHIKPMALINPEVVSEEGLWTMEEGCLCIPQVRAEIERAQKIKVRYRDTSFKLHEIEADGLLARVILHEIDHLNGLLLTDRISQAQKKELKDALEKIQKGEVNVSYPVVSAVNALV